jgi:pimeloyl-ACP methyl ester carboxylesterase
MAYIERDGVRVYFEDHGQGPAVLLSHGYSATSQMWRDQVAAFRDRYRVIVWDMRGHGQSDYPEDQGAYSEDHTVHDMAAILDACGVGRAVVGGLSLGGYCSLGFYLEHPARVDALMLFDTGPGFKKGAAREAWNRRAGQRADDLESRGLDALGASAEVRRSNHRSADGLARAARGMLAQRDASVIESLPNIAVPTLVLVGEQDVNFHAATDYMSKKIPGAAKVVIPNAGHGANIDQPEIFNQEMGAFLGQLAF